MGNSTAADRNVVVAGGSRGLGRAIASAFADTGAHVLVIARGGPDLDQLKRLSPLIDTAAGSVGDRGFVEQSISAFGARRGHIDALVNCAGLAGPTVPALQVDAETLETLWSVNVAGALWCIQAVAPFMEQGGAIINLSTASTTTHLPLRLPYVATKAALEAMSKVLARELGHTGIRVNTVRPGPIDNPRNASVRQAKAAVLGIDEAAMLERTLGFTALGKLVPEADVAALVLFLCSPAASHITGQDIGVDGFRLHEE